MNRVLIGHRGEPTHWPENSLAGFRSVLEAGATFVETDVQLTADGVAVLCHDDSLLKLTGENLAVTGTPFERIRDLPAGQPSRFGERFASLRIARLSEFAELLARWPQARAFVEIKGTSIQRFGIDRVLESVLDALDGVQGQCILISFDYPSLAHTGGRCRLPLGWVLPGWDAETRRLAECLAPAYLFVNRRRLPEPAEPLWQGPWQWVVYTVNRVAEARLFHARGFDLVETDDIRRLMHGLHGDD